MITISKFAQKLEKNGVIARFNSLKNVPIFYSQKYDDDIERFIHGDLDESLLGVNEASIVNGLRKNKVLVPSNEYDEMIMTALRKALIKPPYPHIIYLIMTEKCNFACKYCFIERYMDPKKANVMSKETAKQAIDFWAKQISLNPSLFEEEKNVIFYGGEPLTNFSTVVFAAQLINQYIEEGKLPAKTNVSLITNGTLLTDEIVEELKTLGISLSISLDGATKRANSSRVYHDGRDGYEDILRGIDIARKHNCNFGLSITLSQEALEDSDKIFDLIDKYGLKSIGFNILLTDKKYSVPEEYFEKASKFIVDAYKAFREKGIYEDRAMRKVDAFVNHNIHFEDCGAEGGNQLIVAPNGDVGICHGYLSTREFFPTNVFDDNFDMRYDPTFLEWNRRTPLTMKACERCEALGTCGGGCALNAKENGTSIWDLDERFCIHSKMTLEFLIWDLYEQKG